MTSIRIYRDIGAVILLYHARINTYLRTILLTYLLMLFFYLISVCCIVT